MLSLNTSPIASHLAIRTISIIFSASLMYACWWLFAPQSFELFSFMNIILACSVGTFTAPAKNQKNFLSLSEQQEKTVKFTGTAFIMLLYYFFLRTRFTIIKSLLIATLAPVLIIACRTAGQKIGDKFDTWRKNRKQSV